MHEALFEPEDEHACREDEARVDREALQRPARSGAPCQSAAAMPTIAAAETICSATIGPGSSGSR